MNTKHFKVLLGTVVMCLFLPLFTHLEEATTTADANSRGLLGDVGIFFNTTAYASSVYDPSENTASDFEYTISDGKVYISDYNGTATVLEMPEYIEGYPVYSICLNADGSEQTTVQKVILPATARVLEGQAFQGMRLLKSIDGLEHIQHVKRWAFIGCIINDAVFSTNLKQLDSEALVSEGLTRVVIPDDVQFVASESANSFRNFNITSFELLDGDGEATILLQDGVLFTSDKKTLLAYPNGLRSMDYVIPDTTEKINYYAFDYLPASLFIPASVTEIHFWAITSCPSSSRLYVVANSEGYRYANELEEIFDKKFYQYYVVNDAGETMTLDQLVTDIVNSTVTSGMSAYEKAFALYNWVLDNAEYSFDYEYGDEQDLFYAGKAVCEGYARAYAMLLNKAGIEAKYLPVIDKFTGLGHAVTAFKINGSWIYADATWDDNATGRYQYWYFGFEDTILEYFYSVSIDMESKDGKYYYYYYTRQLNEAETRICNEINTYLGNGEVKFSVNHNLEERCSLALAAELRKIDWFPNDEDSMLFITTDTSNNTYVCTVVRVNDEESQSDYEYDFCDDKIRLLNYLGDETEVVVPSVINGYEVAYLKGTFMENSQIEKVVLPDSIIEIGDHTFENCYALTTINVPSNLKQIGADAFRFCCALTGDIDLPEGLTTLEARAFYESAITSVSVPSTVTSVKKAAFASCANLERVSLAEGVSWIAESAFKLCSSLSSISIPDSVTYIGENAFSHCSNLTSINLPDGITKIGDSVFLNCNSLVSINLPDSVTSIGKYAFNGCSSLTSIAIPDGVTSIG